MRLVDRFIESEAISDLLTGGIPQDQLARQEEGGSCQGRAPPERGTIETCGGPTPLPCSTRSHKRPSEGSRVTRDGSEEASRVALTSIDGGDVTTLADGASFGRVLSTGHLLFVREGSVLAAPFDVDALAPQGPAVPVLGTVAMAPSSTVAQFAVATPGVSSPVA